MDGRRGFGVSEGEFNRQVAKDAKGEIEFWILDYEWKSFKTWRSWRLGG
jgi:hypothetical protein